MVRRRADRFNGAHPILINRPIVETPLGVRSPGLRRGSSKFLPSTYIGPFVKEDGAVVIDLGGEAALPDLTDLP